jgi:hypothetical protein
VFYRDLATECGVMRSDRVRAIGWLSSAHSFTTGEIPAAFVAALEAQLSGVYWAGNVVALGFFSCELCPRAKQVIGKDELFIPSAAALYVAPRLVGHYVTAHAYLPPAEFVGAVGSCPPQCSPEFWNLMRPYFRDFSLGGLCEEVVDEQIARFRIWADIDALWRRFPAAEAMIRSGGELSNLRFEQQRFEAYVVWYENLMRERWGKVPERKHIVDNVARELDNPIDLEPLLAVCDRPPTDAGTAEMQRLIGTALGSDEAAHSRVVHAVVDSQLEEFQRARGEVPG